MATHSQSGIVPQMTGDTEFRAVCQFVYDAMIAMGFVQTADTGQLNPATVTRPGAINTVAGYLMFRSNDGLTHYYVKLELGTGSNVQYASLWSTVGWGTDGAGALSSGAGNVSTRTQGATTTAPGTTTRTCYASGRQDTTFRAQGWIELFGNAGNQIAHLVMFERTRNANGTVRSDEVFIAHFYGNNAAYFQVVPQSGTLPAQLTYAAISGLVAHPSTTSNNDQYGGATGTGLFFPQKGGLLPPLSMAQSILNTRVLEGQTEPISTYGESKTFLFIADFPRIDSGRTLSFLLRYD